MASNLTLEELRAEVAGGSIDTVLVCQVDMQGRLMGKRMQGEYFVDSAWEETHSCNYLLATDMEMETVEGYRSTSWASGYGDYVMKPDLATLRRVPLARRHRHGALQTCWITRPTPPCRTRRARCCSARWRGSPIRV